MFEIIAGLLLIIGSLFILIATIGILRMPDIFLRMSATTKAATLGICVVLIGTAMFYQDFGILTRVVIIIMFLGLTAPVAAHMIGRAAYLEGLPLWHKTHIDEMKDEFPRKKNKKFL